MKCFNRNVVIGLAAVAAVLFFAVPSARGLLPLLAVAACPLSMIFMMGAMAKTGGSKNSCATDRAAPQDSVAAKDAEIARLNGLLQQQRAAERN